jgi:hypothetical protein
VVDSVLSFLSFWWQPIVGFIVVAALLWFTIRDTRSPEFIEMMQKADYERAHAYTKGKCCCGKD